MKWDNIDKIVKSLNEEHLGEDISGLNLSDLHDMIIHLNDFEDDPEVYNRKVLQSILQRWQEMVL
jgi:FeS assembly protein IscX